MDAVMRMVKMARKYWSLIITSFALTLLATVLTMATPWVISKLTEELKSATGVDMRMIVAFSLVLTGACILRGVFKFFSFYISHYAAWTFLPWLTQSIYNKLQRLSMRFYHDKQTGELMSRAVNDARQMEMLFAHALPDLMSSILITVLVTIVLFTINPALAALTMIPIPFIIIGSIVFMKKVGPIMSKNQKALGQLNAALQDNISGIKEIQAFGQEDKEFQKITEISNIHGRGVVRWSKMNSFFVPLIEFLTSIGTIFVVAFGGYLAVHGKMTAADIVGFILYLGLYYQPIATLARLTEDIQTAKAGAERVIDVLDAFEEITDSPNAAEMKDCDGTVEFRGVSFHYLPDQPILKDINFRAEKGQMIALVGPTGVGKTTMVSLLERFYDPIEGQVIISGMDIRDVTISSLRRHISIILQDVFLFNGTIAENIAYGVKEASREEIQRAAVVASADRFISEMPNGYDTYIGERGVRLSGGQKQRIAIARAVLRDTPILIMDEATAAVDVETEMEIQQAVAALVGNRTVFVIAHRLSTVKKADTILVLENGRIVESGSHDTLVTAGGLYQRLCHIQLQASEDVMRALSQYSESQ